MLVLLSLLAVPPALFLAAHSVWRLRRLRLPAVTRHGTVTLVMALTGPAPGLPHLLSGLIAQSLRPRRLVVGIESEADPAFARVRDLAPCCPFPVETRLAGHVPWRGQKSTNLIAALAAVDDADEAVVLLDGDIRPQPWWLSAAASPAIEGTHDVITGFRWQVLEGRGFVAHLVAWIDRMGAVLILPPRYGLVWGGTIGLSRRALARLDLPRVLDRALVDDLTIGAAAKAAGLSILSRGAITVPTPSEGAAGAQLRFLRRQLQVVRICQPGFWVALMGLVHVSALGWLAALAALPHPGAAAVLLLLSGCGVARAVAHARIGAGVGVPDPPGGLLVQVLIGAVPPLSDGLIAGLGWTMLRARRLRWRHVEYAVDGPEAVRVIARHPHAG